ncbi:MULTISPECIES: DUF1772 domain-containing protein [unclassified Sinorhizobium]|uniref:DUF1772 domain-containing protein n=1 Tax=unclassified Sinorhizobium TaxID=2613772 RepID=UPI003526683A
MTRRILLFRLLTLLLAALSLALSFCHLMEMPVRLGWQPALWMMVTNFGGLYLIFGTAGAAIDVLAIIASALLAFLVRNRRPSFQLTIAGSAFMAAGLAIWFAFVAPMNAIMATWSPGPIPENFASVRNQWEYSHAIIAMMKFVGMTFLLLSVLVETGSARASTQK